MSKSRRTIRHKPFAVSSEKMFGEDFNSAELLRRTMVADQMRKVLGDDQPIHGLPPNHLGLRIFALLAVTPGLKIGAIANQLQESRESVASMLPTMESLGLLLYEDGEDRLYPHSISDTPFVLGGIR